MPSTAKKISAKCPPPLREILSKVRTYDEAAQWAGLSQSYVASAARGKTKVTPASLAKIEAGLALLKEGGTPPGRGTRKGNGLDHAAPTGKLGFVICFVPSKLAERLIDAGDQLGCSLAWKRRVAVGKWILMMHHKKKPTLRAFATMAALVG